MKTCPPLEAIAELLEGSLDETVAEDLEGHLDSCPGCLSRFNTTAQRTEQEWASWQRLIDSDRSGETDLKATLPGIADGTPTVAGYTIFEELGRGGMGVVYRAHQNGLGRDVALKVLAPNPVPDPERWLRFRTEARAIARLDHPNIIRVFDSGYDSDLPYVAQELAESGNLSDLIGGRPQSPRDAAKTVQQLADAVAHAHGQGVLHRDIKPSNVFLAGDVVKLGDFGLAKVIDSNNELTQTRDILGTPAYMAPEQTTADQSQIGPSTDIYALGVLLYVMLVGRPPFEADTPIETLRLVQEHDPVAPRRLQPAIPIDLETICLKCLSRHPSDRYGSAAALSDDLRRWLDGCPILARPVPPWRRAWKWSRRHPAAAGLVAMTALAAFTLLGMWWRFTARLTAEQGRTAAEATLAKERLAEQIEANEATNEVLDFLTSGLFDSAIPDNEGIDLTVLQALDQADSTIDKRFEGRPRVEAAVRSAMGNTYREIGQPLRAAEHLERAVLLYEELDDNALAEAEFDTRHAYALCLETLGRKAEAQELLDDLLKPEWHLDIERRLNVRFAYADYFVRDVSFEEGLGHWNELLADCRRELGDDHERTLSVYGSVGVQYFKNGQLEKAHEVFTQVLANCRESLGEDYWQTFTIANNLAITLVRLGRLEEAEAVHRDTWERKERTLGVDHFSTIGSKQNLAMVLWRQKRESAATKLLAEVCEQRSRTFGPTDRRTLESIYQLGRMYEEMKAFADGKAIYDSMLAPHVDEAASTGQWASLMITYSLLLLGAGDADATENLIEHADALMKIDGNSNPSRKNRLAAAKAGLNSQREIGQEE